MREQFISSVKEFLIEKGFIDNEDSFEKTIKYTQQGGTVIINGQQISQQNKEVEIKFIVKEFGDGYYSDTNDDNKVDFTQFELFIFYNNELKSIATIAYRWDDINNFKKDLTNTFNL